MSTKYSLTHLSDDSLHRGLQASVARDRVATAEMLAYLAEFIERRLYVPAGYDSMHAYCLDALHLSEDAALKRTQAAGIARQYPVIFAALEEGRLHLSAVVLLAPKLRKLAEAHRLDRGAELLAAATHKTSAEIRQLLAEWFPAERPAEMLLAVTEYAPEHIAATDSQQVTAPAGDLARSRDETADAQHAPEHVVARDTWARVMPLSGDLFELRGTIDRSTLELLQRNQSLLSHKIPSGNLAEVLRRALAESARQFENRKFRASGTARRVGRAKPGSRHISKQVRDAVWQRDGGQCTYVGDTGHRCGSRTRLEFDHVVPVAHGGTATVHNLRLRCRVHNQFEAERAFGTDFIRHKREQARTVTDARERVPATAVDAPRAEALKASVPALNSVVTAQTSSPQTATAPQATPHAGAAAVPELVADPSSNEQRVPASHSSMPRDWLGEAQTRAAAAGMALTRPEPDVESVLRHLGIGADDAGRATRLCETISDAPLEERLRVALKFLYAKPSPGRATERHGTAA